MQIHIDLYFYVHIGSAYIRTYMHTYTSSFFVRLDIVSYIPLVTPCQCCCLAGCSITGEGEDAKSGIQGQLSGFRGLEIGVSGLGFVGVGFAVPRLLGFSD